MEKIQPSLFDDESAGRPEPGQLVVVSQPGRPLTKAQRAFNRLVARIEKLHAKLREETRRLDDALAFFGVHLHPRRWRLASLRKDLVLALAPFLGHGQLKKGERKTLKTIIAQQLNEIADAEGSLPEGDLRALYERVHGVTFEQAQRAGMEDARAAMEDLFDDFGIDVDLSGMGPNMNEAEFAAEAAKMAERFQQEAGEKKRVFGPAERPKTKRQQEKEERIHKADEVRKKSIATIYKQLARVLHPDLEPDAGLRERKASLMQELTVAYRKNDLHTLLRLELEWIEREKGDVERLTDEKLGIYNDVLKEQATGLECQLDELPLHPRYLPIAVPAGPFGVRLLTNGPAEARRLDLLIESVKASLACLRGGEALGEVRNAIQTHRAVNSRRNPDWTPF